MNHFTAGCLKTQNQDKATEYHYFLPNLLNRSYNLNNAKLLTVLEQATKTLGELNAYGELTPDIDFFIKMHIFSESVASSKIEGTQTNMQEALLPESDIKLEVRDDWDEVHNYIKAMNDSIDNLENLPISLRLLKQTHRQLLSGVRGKNKCPGEVRVSQNWIGGVSINSAHFIPPHHQHLDELLFDWEDFWHNNHKIPILIKIALCHYQFETIHPFLDGNGRIGRLFIILQLIEAQFLSTPILYLSDFFEKNRSAYYQALDKVRQSDDINQWLIFFLEGVTNTAKKSKNTLKNILKLKNEYEIRIIGLGRKAKIAKTILEFLYTDPVVSVKQLQKFSGLKYAASNNLVKDLVKLQILKEITGQNRNRLFVMSEYLDLFARE
ncbi:MloA [Bathymodiolus heckerae thiotrophic gill symbiont]|uniref:Fic family protein n=1 Tax=Bathymodiolus heckerae thiotrophic gill symbiont TaxID=1052212 RepID=UPI0010BB766B|nr:Fic family protein [Bathymodiolus heckerae thiotrophic gill symbiont]SMN13219.1 MloA [Bathymodiolus heckerae thiotrophic gill symbiont]